MEGLADLISHFFNGIGPKRPPMNVRFCAAIGGLADTKRTSSTDL
jgi:hypothetical protein